MRHSYRVQIPGGHSGLLAGIIDRPKDKPDAPVAIFSHCFTCNKDLKAIVRISRALSESGIAVLRFDMSGLGGSDGEFSETNFSTNVADLNAAVEFANDELGSVQALIGHSFGGAASMAVAGNPKRPRSLSALVTLGSPSDTQHLADLMVRMNPTIEKVGSGIVSIGGLDWTITDAMLADFRSHQLPERIANIEASTLVVHSRADETLSYDHALRIMSLIQNGTHSTPVSVLTLGTADHLLTDPRDLQYVSSSMAAFLQRHCGPA